MLTWRGVQAQFSQLSAHAHDMFTALMDESCATLERISNLSARVTSLSTTCSASDDAQLAAAKYAKNNEGRLGRTDGRSSLSSSSWLTRGFAQARSAEQG